jgi:hypothetical protein
MLGIALFFQPFDRMLRKPFGDRHVVLRWLRRGVAMYIATTLGCFPLLIYHFGLLSVVALFVNLLVVPVLVLAFQTCVLALVSYIAFPFLYVMNVLIDAALGFLNLLSNLPFAFAEVTDSGLWFIAYYLGLFFATRFIFTRRRYKWTAAGILIGAYAVSLIIANV